MNPLKFIAQAISCTAILLLANFTALAQGLHYSPQELTAWRQRTASGPYKNAGDAGANTPADWTRINSYADDFKASPSDTGNTNAERLDIWTGYRYTIDSLNQYPIWQGIKMQAAGFKYLLFGDTSYGQAVRRTLLAQVRFTHPIHKGYNVANWPAPKGSNQRPNYESGVPEALWLQRLVYAYDYTKNVYTAAERQEIELFFKGGAKYFSDNIHNNFVRSFPKRLENNYTSRSYMAAPAGVPQWASPIFAPAQHARHMIWGDGFIYTHRNADGSLGNRITTLSFNYNNRMFDKMMLVGLAGLLTGDSALTINARQTVKEFVMFGTWPDGTNGEYERNGDYGNPNQGALLYGSKNLQTIVMLADAFARRGDFSLYSFTTTDGAHGTRVPTGGTPKSIFSILTRFATNAVGNPAIFYGAVAPLNRIDINNENINTQFTINHVTWDYLLAIANKYYQSDFFKKVYTRSASVAAVPYPSRNLTSAGMVWLPWCGAGAELPGTLFMFSQLEAVKPYLSPCQPVTAATITAIGSDNASVTFNTNLGAARGYVVEIRPTGSTTWAASVSTQTRFILANLAGATSYQVRVRSLCSTTDTSAASPVLTFTTLVAPCLVPTSQAAAASGPNQLSVSVAMGTNATAALVEYRTLGATTWSQHTAVSFPTAITGLIPLTVYEVRSSAICGTVTSLPTTATTVTTPAPPCGQGTNLLGQASRPDSAVLSWTAGVNASQYQVRLRAMGSTNWKFVIVAQPRHTESFLAPATTYEFQVNSICQSTISGYTASKQFSTPALAVCDSVSSVVVNNITQTEVTVQWAPANGNTAGYAVRYRARGATTWSQASTLSPSINLSQLPVGSTLELQVQNLCSGNTAPWSFTRVFTTQQAPCGQPTALKIKHLGADSVRLFWVAGVGAVSYALQYTERGTADTQTKQVAGTATALVIKSLRAGASYDLVLTGTCISGQTTTATTSVTLIVTETKQSLAQASYSLAPNPTLGLSKLTGPAGLVQVFIYNAQGAQVATATRILVGAEATDLSDLIPPIPGVYAVHAASATGVQRMRLVRQ